MLGPEISTLVHRLFEMSPLAVHGLVLPHTRTADQPEPQLRILRLHLHNLGPFEEAELTVGHGNHRSHPHFRPSTLVQERHFTEERTVGQEAEALILARDLALAANQDVQFSPS